MGDIESVKYEEHFGRDRLAGANKFGSPTIYDERVTELAAVTRRSLDWGLFGLISAAALWLAWRQPGLKLLPPAALVIALTLLLAWPHPGAGLFAAVLAGLAALHAAPGLWRLARS